MMISLHTLVVVMPAAREVLLDDGGSLVLRQQTVHLVLLPPEQSLGEHLPSLLHVEVTGSEKAK